MKQTLEFLVELIKHRRFVLLSLIISSIIAIIIVFIVPVSYTSSVAIVPPRDSKQSLIGSLTSISKMSSSLNLGGFSAMTVDLYSDVLTSDLVTDSIVSKHNLSKQWGIKSIVQTKRKLKKKTKVNITTSQMLTISVTDSDPEFAAELCNDYVLYLNKAMNYIDKNKLRSQLKTINNLLAYQESHLNELKNQLIAWQNKNNSELLESSSMQKNPAITMLYSKLAEEQLDYYMFKRDHADDSKTLQKQRELIRSIRQSIDSTLNIVNKEPGEVADYIRLKAEFEAAIIMKEEILGRIKYVKGDLNADEIAIYTLGPAGIPDIKSFPPRKIIVIIVFLLVLMTDILILGIKYYFERNYSDKQKEELKESIKRIFNDPFQLKKK
ncbi:MAG: Wzz/FepE/Etk N-terminal domain-containing protein [candidate division WOR-3 bacterium]|nr:Wzz/FepE/Etk N-terminal domain-containing protein [candidate division WOR-3 bacterium]